MEKQRVLITEPRPEVVAALITAACGEWYESSARLGEQCGYRCVYCGLDFLASPENYKLWEAEHIVPRSILTTEGKEQDADKDENLALACRHCNQWKWTFDPRTAVGEDKLNDRKALIGAAWLHIQAQRSKTMAQIERVREVVGWRNGGENHEER
jgi:5-methylcytosine-specific restriction endonuclease McrA